MGAGPGVAADARAAFPTFDQSSFHVERASLDPDFRLHESPDREGLLLVLLRKLDHVELILRR